MLHVVSNRLPVSLAAGGERLRWKSNVGGLAVGLDSLRVGEGVRWTGWPGPVPHAKRALASRQLRRRYGCDPVYLSERLVKGYYNGFSNRTLWPLFHTFPALANYSPSEWEAYKAANGLFARQVAGRAGRGDSVWVHDFHLLLVPEMLRAARPDLKIGFFLHIPFPSHDTLRLIPWHREILRGMAGADLVGFHTYDYAQAFLTGMRRLLGCDNALGQVFLEERSFDVDVFPMGIDYARFAAAASDPSVEREAQRIRAIQVGRRLSFSVSRLDYTKGIPQQLAAIDTFLSRHPEWHGRFNHVLVVVPSRERVAAYRALRREIEGLVGRINGRHGTVDWIPLRYVYGRLSSVELAGLYAAADVGLITPARDGMNLVAKEYIATRQDGEGVLVLSDMAGSARELTRAIVVNPNNRDAVAQALLEALEMPAAEKRACSAAMRAALEANSVQAWSARFLGRLDAASRRSRARSAQWFNMHHAHEMEVEFSRARRRLLLLDYDGTLVPFSVDPAQAAPDAAVTELVQQLADQRATHVVIISGRPKQTLGRWFGGVDATLVAEHGVWVREVGARRWRRLVRVAVDWKPRVREVMDLFVGRIPGSFVEDKEHSLVWHFRGSDPHIAAEASREMLEALTTITANTPVVVQPGRSILEVRPAAASKGSYFVSRLARDRPDFILAVGDDSTDEDLFRALPPSALTIRVGQAASAARFNVRDYGQVRQLLGQLSRADALRAGRA